MTRITPGEIDWQLARDVHNTFVRLPGSHWIATPFALAHLAAVLSQNQIGSVLEIGAGIGTISYFLLTQDTTRTVYSAEDHPYCVGALRKNIPDYLANRFNLITDYSEVGALREQFDLVIFDGLTQDSGAYSLLGEGSYCFIEGSRSSTRRAIQENLNARGLVCMFENYSQGRRWLPIEWRRTKGGTPYPRLKFIRTIKGCWIGQVVRHQG